MMLLSPTWPAARAPSTVPTKASTHGVEALVAEDELLGERLEPQDRVDPAGQARPQLLERRHLADLVAEVDQEDWNVRIAQHPAGQAVAGGGARRQDGVHRRAQPRYPASSRSAQRKKTVAGTSRARTVGSRLSVKNCWKVAGVSAPGRSSV